MEDDDHRLRDAQALHPAGFGPARFSWTAIELERRLLELGFVEGATLAILPRFFQSQDGGMA